MLPSTDSSDVMFIAFHFVWFFKHESHLINKFLKWHRSM